MKKLLTFLFLLCSLSVLSQTAPPNYTNINSRYQWLAGRFKALSLPAGDTVFQSGQWPIAGAVVYDSTKPVGQRFWVWNGQYWEGVGSGGGTQRPVYATNGLTAVNDSTVRLGGTLTDTTTIYMPANTRMRWAANGINPYMEDNQKPSWFTFKSTDTLAPTYSYSNIGKHFYSEQRLHMPGKRYDYLKGSDFYLYMTNADSTYTYSVGGDFSYTLKAVKVFTKASNTRNVFRSSPQIFDAPPTFISWTRVQRPAGYTQSTRLTNWHAGISSYLFTDNVADTVDGWIAYTSLGYIQANSRVRKVINYYPGAGVNNSNVDSVWSMYSEYANPTLYHKGKVSIGAGSGPTEQLELFGNFKHYNLRSSHAADDSMVVWNETDKIYGKRPIPSAGSSQNLANTDLTQTAARVFDHDGYSLYWGNSANTRWYGSGAYSTERMMAIEGTGGRWVAGRLSANKYYEVTDSLKAVGLGLSNDTTSKKIVTVNPGTGALTYSNWPTAGGDVEDFPTEIKAYRDMGGSAVAETLGLPLIMANRSIALMDGQIRWIPVRVDKTCTITRVKLFFRTQGSFTGDNNNKVGLYTLSGTTLTQVAVTANDDNIFKASTNSYGDATFVTPYNASPGIYWVAVLWNASSTTTAPAIAAATNDLGNVAMGNIGFHSDIKMHGFISSQSDLPSTQAMSGISASSTPFYVILEDFVP